MSAAKKLQIATQTLDLSPIDAYLEKEKLDKQIAILNRRSKELKQIVESAFKKNQKRYQDDSGFNILVREEQHRTGYTVQPFSFWKYNLEINL